MKEASMKPTALKTALGGSALLIALLSGAALLPATASAGEHQSYWGDGAPGTVEQVRRRIFVAPDYGYDPYYAGPAYYPPAGAYAPPVAYAPPPYDYAPPVDYDYGPAPGVAVIGPGVGFAIGY